jgi:hypothetical protein
MTGNPPAGPGTGAPATATGVANAAGDSNWSQSDVRLTTHQELSALTVELRVARTNGVTATGSSTSIPQQTRVSVVTDGDYLIYRWSLDRGQTLAADTYTFAGRFGHAPGGRDTSRDRYAVAGVGRDGPIALGGGF